MGKKSKTAIFPMTDGGAPYRLGVGLVVFNANGLVLVAERRDTPGAWQWPQGGIDEGEAPEQAAVRELLEELGTNKAELIATYPGYTRYEFPDYLLASGAAFKGKYRGQQQYWFAFRFTGTDADIQLVNNHEGEQPEFSSFRWMPLTKVPALIVPFKRGVYEQVAAAFASLAVT
jgi:putative (di)nucleoside polyphosphate hydrolase